MAETIWFWAMVCALVAWGGYLIWDSVQQDRERTRLVAEIKDRPSTCLWITEDGCIHTVCPMAETEELLVLALEAVRQDIEADRQPGVSDE